MLSHCCVVMLLICHVTGCRIVLLWHCHVVALSCCGIVFASFTRWCINANDVRAQLCQLCHILLLSCCLIVKFLHYYNVCCNITFYVPPQSVTRHNSWIKRTRIDKFQQSEITGISHLCEMIARLLGHSKKCKIRMNTLLLRWKYPYL